MIYNSTPGLMSSRCQLPAAPLAGKCYKSTQIRSTRMNLPYKVQHIRKSLRAPEAIFCGWGANFLKSSMLSSKVNSCVLIVTFWKYLLQKQDILEFASIYQLSDSK